MLFFFMGGKGRDSEGLSLPLFFFSRGGVVRHHFRSPPSKTFFCPSLTRRRSRSPRPLKVELGWRPAPPLPPPFFPPPRPSNHSPEKGRGAPPKMGVSGRGRRRGCFGFLCARVAPEKGGEGESGREEEGLLPLHHPTLFSPQYR